MIIKRFLPHPPFVHLLPNGEGDINRISQNIIMQETYDLIIIGAGPAGLAASIYASRYKLNHLLLGATIGGQINEIRQLENWPGDKSVSGLDLLSRFVEHTKNLGITPQNESVVSVKKNEENVFEVETGKNAHKARAVIMAMGTEYRKMNIPGEKELTGKGVSYCATCDAMFFREKVICVVGGGNAAVTSALGRYFAWFRRCWYYWCRLWWYWVNFGYCWIYTVWF